MKNIFYTKLKSVKIIVWKQSCSSFLHGPWRYRKSILGFLPIVIFIKWWEILFAAYLHRGGVNIIIVDWSPLCAFPWYSHAVLNTRVAALYLAKFIVYLTSRGFRLSKMHLIGFSLGAEIAGFTGKNLKIGKLPRITGQYTATSHSY